MKKAIIAILIIALLGGAGFLVYSQMTSPEKQIIGKWESESGIGYYDFKEEGVVTIGTSVVSISYNGTYVIDKENSTVTITYSALGVSYDDKKIFTIDDDKLTLEDATLGTVVNYNRVVEA